MPKQTNYQDRFALDPELLLFTKRPDVVDLPDLNPVVIDSEESDRWAWERARDEAYLRHKVMGFEEE